MKRIYNRAYTLAQLSKLIDSRIFAVPQLQREFVWNSAKACQLLDSIFHNYPIGTILVWKTKTRNESLLRKTLHILPPYDAANGDVYFLVDGQQRLSVLWNLLNGEGRRVENSDGKTVDFSRIYFDAAGGEGEPLFISRARATGELSQRLVPVVDILGSKWQRSIRNFGKRIRARIADCRRRLLNYKAFFVFFETSTLTEVRETFIRINSLGMRVGSADRAFARAARVDLRNHVGDVLQRLKNGFNGIRRETVLQTIAFALGVKDVGDKAIDQMVRRLETNDDELYRFNKIWPTLRHSFAEACDWFTQLGVPSMEFLPSEPMVSVLTLYFFHNRNKRPPPAAKQTIRRWFWATAVGARYTGQGYRPNITSDIDFARKLAAKPGTHLNVNVAVQPFVLKQTEYRRPGPMSNAFFVLLQSLGPRYLEDAASIPLGDISSRRNRRDKHHIFPRALLKRAGMGADQFNSILNICYLTAWENQSVGQRAPAMYLYDVPRSASVRRRVMRSHLIPDERGVGVWRNDSKKGFREFLVQRTRLLIKAFENEAGMRLFDRS